MNKTRKPLDLTTCSITSGLIRFSLPFLASSILQTMYSTVDTIIVGQFCGSAGLAAVNNVSYICNAASNIGLGASAGSAVLVAQYCGAKMRGRTPDGGHGAVHQRDYGRDYLGDRLLLHRPDPEPGEYARGGPGRGAELSDDSCGLLPDFVLLQLHHLVLAGHG